MPKIACFTSANIRYLPKARIVAETTKRVHPDWEFHLVLSDETPRWFALDDEPFDGVIRIEDLDIDNWKGWVFKHELVELCTAVKGPALVHLLGKANADYVIYLDPDIAVFNDLGRVIEILDEHPIILTPHQLTPDTDLATIRDNEVCSLRHGVYNLGFLAVKNEGQGIDFAHWWRDRLLEFCYWDLWAGLFTDQRWCDHAPVFFDRLHILRDTAYNVATWNISRRNVSVSDGGDVLVNGQPLRFYHFTGFDSGAGARMRSRYGEGNRAVAELWDWYGAQLVEKGQSALGDAPWAFDRFDNGTKITPPMRIVYRNRGKTQQRYPQPFDTRGWNTYLWWWRRKGWRYVRRYRSPERYKRSPIDWGEW